AQARGLLLGALVAGGHDLALVDPDLDADAAGLGLRLGEAVIDVGAQRVQRHAALGVLLRARHLRATEAAAAADAHALGARAHGRGQGALHGAPERDTVLQLLCHGLGHQLGVQLRPLDLVDVHVHGLVRHGVHVLAQGLDLAAGLADHDAGARRVDVDRDPLGVLADVDVGEAGVRELAANVIADAHVLDQVRPELLLGEPVRFPVMDDPDAEAARVDLLTHYESPSSAVFSAASSATCSAGSVGFAGGFLRGALGVAAFGSAVSAGSAV